MRKVTCWKKFITVMMQFCLIVMLLPIHADAAGLQEETKLTLYYEGGRNTFHFYKIAEYVGPNQYTVAERFQSYVGKVTGLDRIQDLDAEEMKMLSSTLRSITITNGMEPDETLETDDTGKLVWNNTPKAMYLIVGDKTYDAEYIYTPMPVILSVPYEITEGEWMDNVEVLHNKMEKKEREMAARISVTLVWRNKPSEEDVPEEVEVTLFENDIPYEEEELDEENNWSHTWEDLEPEEEWNVEEEELPDGFTYSYVPDDDGIVIINTYEEEAEPELDETIPQTGQIWWPVPVLAVWGCSFYMMGWFLDKKKIV